MAKKSSVNSTAKTDQPGLFDQAGEALGHIGEKISDAKDSVVDFVSTEVVLVRKAAKKIARKVKKAVKKTPAKKAPVKKAAVKKAVRKVGKKAAPKKKAAKKPVKKSARKAAPKKKRK